ncbi:MAG TPA: hypothetical protein PLB10_05865 [Thiolinea sp.]|nr:hypothetical protein [Thiolinea sp.]
MDEDQFRSIYREINPRRCVFEKAILNLRCDCHSKQRFLLAAREGVGCDSAAALARCTRFLEQLRHNARFAFHETAIDGPLPHNRELKVQAGGCLALQKYLTPVSADGGTDTGQVPDIRTLLDQALQQDPQLENLPWGELVRGITGYESRRRRRGGK